MLTVERWNRQSGYTSWTDSGDSNANLVMGIAASGQDLVPGLMIRLHKDAADSVGDYLFQSAALVDMPLRLQNQQALALLRDWEAQPDELGDAWWADFEQDLRHNRLAFRRRA